MAAYKLLLLVAIAATGLQLSVCDEKPEVTKQVQTTVKPIIQNIELKPQAPPKAAIENIETEPQTTAKPEIENIETASQTTAKSEIENAETKAHALERKIFQNIDAKWLAIVYKKKPVFECDCSQSNIANGLEHIAHGILISPNSVAIPIVKKLPKTSDLVIRVYDMKLNSTITRSTPYQEREVILVQKSKRNTKAAHFELLGFRDPIENIVSPRNYGIKSNHCYQLYLNKISNDYVFRALKVSDHVPTKSDANTVIQVVYRNHLYLGAIEAVVPKNVTEAVRDLPYGSPLVCYDVQHSTTSVIGVNVELKELAEWEMIYYYMRTNGVFSV